jgi:hypothetical protein
VDSFAFNNCTALKTIGLPDTITNMGARPFFLTAYETALEKNTKSDFIILGGYILYKYTGNDSDIVIPDGVKVIANSVFAYDESSGSTINSVVFPDSTEYICEYAFWECSGITSLTFGSGIQNIKLSSFTGQDITIYGYMGTYAQDFATTSKYTFVPLLSYGESRTEIYYSNNLRQYYFSDEEAFSKDGIKVYTRNYNGTLSEITDWGFTSTPKSEY